MIAITHHKICNRTSAMSLLVRAWAELDDKHFTNGECLIHWEDEALTYRAGDSDIGVLSFNHLVHNRSFYIKLGWVHRSHRQSGVYTMLFNHLVKLAQSRDVAFIEGGRHVNNLIKARVDERMERYTYGIVTTFAVPPTSPKPPPARND